MRDVRLVGELLRLVGEPNREGREGVGEGWDPGLRLDDAFEGLAARGEADLVEAIERFEGIRGTLLVLECPRGGRPTVGCLV